MSDKDCANAHEQMEHRKILYHFVIFTLINDKLTFKNQSIRANTSAL